MPRHREGAGASRRWRGLSLLLIGLVGGTLLLAPAGAHIGTPNHLWKKHIKPKADKRYLRRGPVKISHSGQFSVNAGIGNGFVADFVDAVRIESTGAGNVLAQLHLVVPDQIGAKGNYGLRRIQICYRVSGGDKIDRTELWDNLGSEEHDPVFVDMTDRTAVSGECYAVSPPSTLDPAGSLVLLIWFTANASGDQMHVSSVTTIWVPVGAGTMSPLSPAQGGGPERSTAD